MEVLHLGGWSLCLAAMPVLPVVTRELAVQARRKSTYWLRVLASLIAGFLMLWLLVITAASAPSTGQGRALFTVLGILAFVYCLIVGALVTSDSMSSEKRDGTLGLLFLTDLKGYDVVFGKLASSSLHAVYGLIAVMPMMSLALLFGGVSATELARTFLVLGNTLFLSLSAGIFVSSISRNERKAAFGSLLIVLAVVFGPYPLAHYLPDQIPGWELPVRIRESILSASPIYAFRWLWSGPGMRAGVAEFYGSLLATQIVGWVCLMLACIAAPRVWRDRAAGRRQVEWKEMWRNLAHGNREARAIRRRRMLDRSPFLWLCNQHHNREAWALILPMAGLAAWIYVGYRQVFFEAVWFLLIVTAVLLKVWIAAEVCSRWIEDRRSGALELLLSAPVGPTDLIRGQSLALRHQFGAAIAVVLGASMLLWGSAAYGPWRDWAVYDRQRSWLLAMVIVFFADIAALRWVGTWQGLTARGLNRAIAGTIFRVLVLRWLVYASIAGAALVWGWVQMRRIETFSSHLVWSGVALTFDAFFVWSVRRSVLRHFRSVAADPSGFNDVASDPLDASSVAAPDAEVTVVAPRRRRLRPALRYTIIAAIVLCSIALIYRFTFTYRMNSRLAAWRAAGNAGSWSEMDRNRTPIDPLMDAAVVIDRMTPILVHERQWPAAIRNSMRSQRPRLQSVLDPEWRHSISSVLSSNAAALKILHETPPLTQGNYPVVPDGIGAARIPTQLMALATVAQLLELEAMLKVGDGDTAGALKSTVRLLELGRSLNSVSRSWAHVQNQYYQAAGRALELLLSRRMLTDEQIQSLQKAVEESERALAPNQIAAKLVCDAVEMSSVPVAVPGMAIPMGMPRLARLEVFGAQLRAKIAEWSGEKERHVLRVLDAAEEMTSKAGAMERLRKARLALGELPARPQGRWRMQSLRDHMTHMAAGFLPLGSELQSRCRTMACALAIERYRLRHDGRLPDTLADLVPEFLLSVPMDAFDDQPIRFRVTDREWFVYSVGRDGTDDRGSIPRLLRVPSVPLILTHGLDAPGDVGVAVRR